MSAGPFIVTHRPAQSELRSLDYVAARDSRYATRALEEADGVYREAFATLEGPRGARERAKAIVADRLAGDSAYEDADALDVFRGSISLPDGSVIEVEATTWQRIADDLDAAGHAALLDRYDRSEASAADLLAAWNAEHGIGAER